MYGLRNTSSIKIRRDGLSGVSEGRTQLEVEQEQPISTPQLQQNGYRLVSSYKTPKATEVPADETENLTPGQRLLKEAQALLEEENRKKSEEEERQRKAQQEPVAAPQSTEPASSLVEQRVNTLLGFFTRTYQALDLALVDAEPTTEEPAAPTTRGLLIRMVNSYAAAERQTEHEIWKYLYGQFDLRNGFNVYAHAPGKGERNYLTIIGKTGILKPCTTSQKSCLCCLS
ncbi:hypothetical protein IC229_05015 [Spirosoma sp. BT702]|uniref:Uncharacterized protein n=1 Tax=Spirosoma profusum TaxID=2771354 RepID=A0A926XU42_9BACT|nr:hypothetical protein [Spirosoma profusum]MBD2699984.1 hypothetical protein [Spirosoma profusum]